MEIIKIFNKLFGRGDLWNKVNHNKYRLHVAVSPIDFELDDKVVYIKDLKKRRKAYGICGACHKPGTGERWCQPCNAKRFAANFKNWTSGNKDIDELIQHSQLNAIYNAKCLEWIPYENFQDVTYITRGGFAKIYSAKWSEGCICHWNIQNKKWIRASNIKIVLKSLDDSSNISTDFLNEIKSHLQIDIWDIIPCYGITQDPDTKNYMMVLHYCEKGNLREYLNQPKHINCYSKIQHLLQIAKGLVDIHNAEKVHKDLHSGNILFGKNYLYISDLGMCQPANNEAQSVKKEGNFGVLPYMAPEVLRGCQYTKAADIYSFGIIMNEFMSEEIPYNNIPHDYTLSIKICKGLRPKIYNDTPKLLIDLIIKCWDTDAKKRPTSKELYQLLKKWNDESLITGSKIYFQVKECNTIRKNALKISSDGNKLNIQTHPQAFYISRLLNFKSIPAESSSQFNSDAISTRSVNPISECFDVQLSESDLNEIDEFDQDDKNDK